MDVVLLSQGECQADRLPVNHLAFSYYGYQRCFESLHSISILLKENSLLHHSHKTNTDYFDLCESKDKSMELEKGII